MKTLSKLILVVLFTLGMSSVATSDVSDILEAHFEAVGGLARLSEIRTVKRVANVQLTQFNGQSVNIPGIVEEAIVVGKKSYVKRHFSGFGDTIVWNGTAGWKSTLLLCQSLLEGYSFLSLIRASSVVNRQWTVVPC